MTWEWHLSTFPSFWTLWKNGRWTKICKISLACAVFHFEIYPTHPTPWSWPSFQDCCWNPLLQSGGLVELHVTFHMDNGPIALLIVYVRRWIHDLNFAEVNIRLVNKQIPEIECHCFIAQFPITVESCTWVELRLMGVISIHNTHFHSTIYSFIKRCPELLWEEVVSILAAKVDLIVVHHKPGQLLHQNLVFWRRKKSFA